MQPPRPNPPATEKELMLRCEAIAGLTLGELAERYGLVIPADLKRHKGWVGQLLEYCLGADAGSNAEPDFTRLGVELKTIPLDERGLPRESTYVCTVPLEGSAAHSWDTSWLRRKLARVLWLPVEAAAAIPLAQRRVGTALLWSPDREEEQQLRSDWEELMDMVCLGELERITARYGEVLQIRPKAANAQVMRNAVGSDGERIVTNPRGFYLRAAFTRRILQKHYAVSL